MATKTINDSAKDNLQNEELLEVYNLRDKHNIKNSVFQGVCTGMGWTLGKQVSEKDFLKAVDEFMSSPINRKREDGSKCLKM